MSDRLVIDEVDATCFALRGEIDAYTAPSLDAHFESLPPGADDVTIDMANITFVDSTGLHVLIERDRRFGGDGDRRLVLRHPSRALLRLLDVAGLKDHFTIVR